LIGQERATLPRRLSRSLPQPLVIPDLMMLKTLADVRDLMRHLPEDRWARSTWRQVAVDIQAAAAGGDNLRRREREGLFRTDVNHFPGF
jgi:hypothetical protein